MAEERDETGEVGESDDGGSDGGRGEGESRDARARAEFEDDGGSRVGGGVADQPAPDAGLGDVRTEEYAGVPDGESRGGDGVGVVVLGGGAALVDASRPAAARAVPTLFPWMRECAALAEGACAILSGGASSGAPGTRSS